jgi:hypothetical protein
MVGGCHASPCSAAGQRGQESRVSFGAFDPFIGYGLLLLLLLLAVLAAVLTTRWTLHK